MCRVRWVVLSFVLVLCAACGGEGESRSAEPGAAGAGSATAAGATGSAADRRADGELLVVFLGDSLTAGYGLAEEQAFPALVAEELRDEGFELQVVNAGVSGDTTAGGLARLDWLLRQEPDVVVVGLGGNDGLRGQPLESIEENLRQIVVRARDAGARVLLLGMRIPPSYGLDYSQGFAEIYPRLAEELDVALIPFLLEGVAARPAMNLPDRLHPNARGHERLAENVAPYVEDLLEER